MKVQYNITKKFLIREYVVKEKSECQIGKIIGCHPSTIHRRLEEYGLPIRKRKEHYNVDKNHPKFIKGITKHFLIQEYSKNKRTPDNIAKEIGCSITPIYDRLIKYNIHMRTMSKSHVKCSFITKELLVKEYSKNKKSREQIARELGCGHTTIGNKLREYNIPIRTLKEANKLTHWRNGLSRFPYPIEWTETLKGSIRQRDNYTCQKCGKKQSELKGRIKKLDIHHIDYNKDNLNPDNLITLCKSCNSKANFDRDYWFAYFTYLIKEIK